MTTTMTTAPTGDEASGPRAGGGRRIGAFLIDTVVAGVPFSLLATKLPAAVGTVLGAAVWMAYFALLESRPAGQTLGKRLFGIRVIVFTDGGPLDLPRAALRAAVRFVGSAALGIGYLVAFFDREKQAWHDVAAQTVVVPVSDYPVG
jgi:uncharacterized RDD family membrane protein YckC